MPIELTLEDLVDHLKMRSKLGVEDLKDASLRNEIYRSTCTGRHMKEGVTILLTRDTGHHTCGWWKNPDYEACIHLSLSFFDPETKMPRKKDRKITDSIIERVFGPTKNFIWSEPPYSEQGKRMDVWHYRVFYDPQFLAPILPRGEVYNKEFTEAGWLSWSDYQAKQKALAERPKA